MGSSQSKVKSRYNSLSTPIDEKDSKSIYDAFASKLREIDDAGPSTELSHKSLEKWEDKLLSDPKNRLALSAISRVDMRQVVQQNSAMIKDEQVFSDQVAFDGAPITNQRSSGRCWIFAATSVFRVALMKKYKLSNFELSQNYLFFYDKLEKAHYFLEQVIDTADEDLESRLVNHLFKTPVNDGGQWDMIINVVEKYGVVPQSVYPDSYNSKASSPLNWIVTNKLREDGLILRNLIADKRNLKKDIQAAKMKMMEEIYCMLVIALGAPPKANTSFTWEFRDKNDKFHSYETTPLEFYHKFVNYDAGKHFSLVNDPRHEYGKLYTVDRLSNVVEGKPIRYVNVDMETMKKAAIKMIRADQPVFFGSDVGKYLQDGGGKGIMDTNLFDYELAFGTKLGMNKAQRLQVNESAMTHAMVLHGVHMVDDEAKKWKVQNSWGTDRGQDGWFIMTTPWMHEYCYQIVTSADYVPKEVADVLDSDPVVLPAWDPLGALA